MYVHQGGEIPLFIDAGFYSPYRMDKYLIVLDIQP